MAAKCERHYPSVERRIEGDVSRSGQSRQVFVAHRAGRQKSNGTRYNLGDATFEADKETSTYSFSYSTTLAHLIINEYHDATQWVFISSIQVRTASKKRAVRR